MDKLRKAVFVDRDGTLNYDNGYTHKISDLKIYDDIIPVLKDYYDQGYVIIVITNQSGINRGYYSIEDMEAFNTRLAEIFIKHGIKIEEFFYCPHRPDEHCSCRKPETGLIEMAAEKYGIDIKSSIVIGDSESTDGKMASRLGIKFIKVHGYN
ncbi:MAG: HAD family hydrolase [Ferroplasma sp.]|uniref:D-glycero-alpha-D-manno-heptose-1,7-bisphosphate 7-phosphatase n=1 Tax=Ferroplasma sp. TaxID=2591003 RepID=UPI002814BE1E|nr:HAD family hydrolase [Ferroplasma sp.]WMT50679.1 MAG: HAD family hydrolase [Ferroplasma sp.]